MTLGQGSMREAINNIHTTLRNDEELLRLLYYPPANASTDRPDPLSNELTNLVGSAEHWDIIDEYIVVGETDNKLVESDKCRLYIRTGRRRSKFGKYLVADQELVITLYVPNDFQRRDYRLDWIDDRLQQLLTHETISGFGAIQYIQGSSRVAPHNYACYEHVYQFGMMKK